jgi:ABC-type amino acid transport substrate-binding protein
MTTVNVRVGWYYTPRVDSIDAFAVRKNDDERLRVINDGLAKLRGDGTLRAVLEKYGQAP